ncbi:helix-turn-helix transcriptional regulator [Nonomuraea longicatena]
MATEHPPLTPAWAELLREKRRQAGWSQKQLAIRLIKATGGSIQLPDLDSVIRRIKDHEAGRHQPTDPYLLLYSRVFDSGDDRLLPKSPAPVPIAPIPALAPDADLYERITRAIREPRRMDEVTLEWLDRCLSEHRYAEDTLGSGPLLPTVMAQFSTVIDLAHGASGTFGGRLVALVAQYAQFVAWMCQDAGNEGAALAWYDRSHAWALEAGDASLAATTLNMRAHQAWSLGDAQKCIRLAEASRWHDGRTTLGVQGMASQMIARGHAQMNDANSARSRLSEAEDMIRRAARHPEDEPPWMYFYDEGWFRMQRGMAELQLGNGNHAVELLEDGLRTLPESYRRDRAWFRACLARAHAVQGDAEAATDVAIKVAPDAVAVNAHAVAELRMTADQLARVDAPGARDIQERLAALTQ